MEKHKKTVRYATKKEAEAFIQGVCLVDCEQPFLFRVGAPRKQKDGTYTVTITKNE